MYMYIYVCINIYRNFCALMYIYVYICVYISIHIYVYIYVFISVYIYLGTRSHGMVIDFVSGDYKDIKIENVESWNGEANGLTIYKESYITKNRLQIAKLKQKRQLKFIFCSK